MLSENMVARFIIRFLPELTSDGPHQPYVLGRHSTDKKTLIHGMERINCLSA